MFQGRKWMNPFMRLILLPLYYHNQHQFQLQYFTLAWVKPNEHSCRFRLSLYHQRPGTCMPRPLIFFFYCLMLSQLSVIAPKVGSILHFGALVWIVFQGSFHFCYCGLGLTGKSDCLNQTRQVWKPLDAGLKWRWTRISTDHTSLWQVMHSWPIEIWRCIKSSNTFLYYDENRPA